MAQMAVDTACRYELAAIETDPRFFVRLLLGAGIVSAAVLGSAVVWHASELALSGPVSQQTQTVAVGSE